jgi:hypothetical protein
MAKREEQEHLSTWDDSKSKTGTTNIYKPNRYGEFCTCTAISNKILYIVFSDSTEKCTSSN